MSQNVFIGVYAKEDRQEEAIKIAKAIGYEIFEGVSSAQNRWKAYGKAKNLRGHLNQIDFQKQEPYDPVNGIRTLVPIRLDLNPNKPLGRTNIKFVFRNGLFTPDEGKKGLYIIIDNWLKVGPEDRVYNAAILIGHGDMPLEKRVCEAVVNFAQEKVKAHNSRGAHQTGYDLCAY